jgi:hypothetical protein
LYNKKWTNSVLRKQNYCVSVVQITDLEFFKLETHQSTFLQVVTRGGYENIWKSINQQAVAETKHILPAKNT